MKDYVIISDSTSDLCDSIAKENKVEIMPFTFYFEDGVMHKNYLDNREMSAHDFYERMRHGEISKTTQVNSEEYRIKLEEVFKSGKNALVICFSSGLSGSFNSLRLAVDELKDEYPDNEVLCVDSLCASMGQGLLLWYGIEAKKKGMTLQENYEYLEKKKYQLSHWFIVDDIQTLRRGGRVSGAAAFVAQTLKIKPVLYIDNEGHLIPRQKKIGRKAAIMELLNQFENRYIPEENETIMISHGDCLEEALYLKDKIVEKFPTVKNVIMNEIGPVIGSHSGPGTIALFFISKER